MRFVLHTALPLLLAPAAVAQFAPSQIIGSVDGAISTRTMDVNGDGRTDVVIGSFFGAFWLENLGGAGFGSVQTIANGYSDVRGVRLADIDEDGDLDPFLSAASNDVVVWFENLGGGAFGPEQPVAAIDGAFAAEAGDLNGDGHLDMLVAGYNADTVAWYSGDGLGGFQFVANLATGFDGARDVALTDVDGDGDLDAIAGAEFDDRIDWFRNDGAGSFSAPILLTTGTNGFSSLSIADLDGDGREDVLSTSFEDDKLAWYRNTGNGFGTQQLISNLSADPFDTTAADLDYDGVQDVIVANRTGDSIAWHKGFGMGFFGQAQVLGSGSQHNGASSVWVSDLDSDGDRDVIGGIFFSDRVMWYESIAELGAVYCAGEANSTGMPGRIAVTGSPNAADNSVALNAEDLPLTQFGFFVTSTTQGFVANPGGSQGNLCLAGAIGRYNRAGEVLFTGIFGTMLLPIDLTDTPLPLGTTSVMAGETRNYQAWYRDSNPGSTSNFTDAVSVTWQ